MGIIVIASGQYEIWAPALDQICHEFLVRGVAPIVADMNKANRRAHRYG